MNGTGPEKGNNMNVISVIVFIIIIIAKINSNAKKAENKSAGEAQRNPIQVRPLPTKSAVPVAPSMTQARPVEVRNSKSETTMTDFLAEKARKEVMNKESEARINQAKTAMSQKGLIMGERLFYGDPVPSGKTKVVCKYCGAENLLPYSIGGKYHCYFCREIL